MGYPKYAEETSISDLAMRGSVAKDNTTISDALTTNSKYLDILEQGMSELIGRLDPILRPSYPEEDVAPTTMSECSEIQGRLSVLGYRLNEQIARLERLMRRIDL